MKTKKILMAALLMAVTQILFAANNQTTTVNFTAPEKFKDFQSRENKSAKDQERLMQQMRKLINQSAKKILAKDLQLTLTVKDVDMAGRLVYPGGSIDLRTNIVNNDTRAIRVIRDIDRELLDFDYQLTNTQGDVIKQGHKVLSTRNIKSSTNSRLKYQNSNFGYIMLEFDRWLKKL